MQTNKHTVAYELIGQMVQEGLSCCSSANDIEIGVQHRDILGYLTRLASEPEIPYLLCLASGGL